MDGDGCDLTKTDFFLFSGSLESGMLTFAGDVVDSLVARCEKKIVRDNIRHDSFPLHFFEQGEGAIIITIRTTRLHQSIVGSPIRLQFSLCYQQIMQRKNININLESLLRRYLK